MKRHFSKLLVLVLVTALVLTQAVPVFAVEANDTGAKGTFNYVALGASNSNGYGLEDYFGDDAYDYPGAAAFGDHVGIGNAVEGSYPVLVKDWLQKELNKGSGGIFSRLGRLFGGGTTVNLDQLGGSGMRSHELRMLLDDTYYGDKFTEWRFFTQGRPNQSRQKAWFGTAEDLAGYRALYKEKIASADFITLDIGMNDFSSFIMIGGLEKDTLLNVPTNYTFYSRSITDLTFSFTEAQAAKFNKVSRWIQDKILSSIGDEGTQETISQVTGFADVLAYAYVSFCKNFDESIKAIRKLNRNADIVVMGIQNSMDGIKIKIGDITIPYGDIYSSIIDMANLYMAGESALLKQYVYTDCGVKGQVDTKASDIVKYNGVPKFSDEGGTIDRTFARYVDALENNFYPASHVVLWLYMNKRNPGDANTLVGATHQNMLFLLSDEGENNGTFSAGRGLFDYYNKHLYEKVREFTYFIDGISAQTDYTRDGMNLAIGTEKKNPRDVIKADQELSGIYDAGYRAAWNVFAWVAKLSLETDTLKIDDISSIGNIGDIEEELVVGISDAIGAEVDKACKAALNGEKYDCSGFGRAEAKELLGSGTKAALAAFYMRSTIAHSIALHPSITGHKQLAEAIEKAYSKNSYTFAQLRDGVKTNISDRITNAKNAVAQTVADVIYGKISGAVTKVIDQYIASIQDKAADNGFYRFIVNTLQTIKKLAAEASIKVSIS